MRGAGVPILSSASVAELPTKLGEPLILAPGAAGLTDCECRRRRVCADTDCRSLSWRRVMVAVIGRHPGFRRGSIGGSAKNNARRLAYRTQDRLEMLRGLLVNRTALRCKFLTGGHAPAFHRIPEYIDRCADRDLAVRHVSSLARHPPPFLAALLAPSTVPIGQFAPSSGLNSCGKQERSGCPMRSDSGPKPQNVGSMVGAYVRLARRCEAAAPGLVIPSSTATRCELHAGVPAHMSRWLGTKSVGACLDVLPAPAPAPQRAGVDGEAHQHCRGHERACEWARWTSTRKTGRSHGQWRWP